MLLLSLRGREGVGALASHICRDDHKSLAHGRKPLVLHCLEQSMVQPRCGTAAHVQQLQQKQQ